MHRSLLLPEPKSKPGTATADRLSPTGAKPSPERPSTMFVELNTRRNDGFTVSLEWNRDTGHTQIVIHDIRMASQTMFGVPGACATDAFRHPFRYAP